MDKKIVFFGSSDFSAEILKYLNELQDLHILRVVTQPDKPFGRKKILTPTPVKLMAEGLGLEISQPGSLKKLEPYYQLRELDYDYGVVVAYGKIIPKRVIETARFCYLNGHASDLPRFRGAAPMERALMAGDHETALCIMRMNEFLDEGGVFLRREIPIHENMDIFGLQEQMLEECKLGFQEYFANPSIYNALPQDLSGINYAQKLSRNDSRISLLEEGREIFNSLRGLKQSYGISLHLEGKEVIVWDATFEDHPGQGAGEILVRNKKELVLSLKNGELKILELQVKGKKRLKVRDYLSGCHLEVGDQFKGWEE